MATVCPWQPTALAPTSPQQPPSPTLQEIMDEELARRLQDEEDFQLIRDADWQLLDPEGSSSDDDQVDDEFEEKEPLQGNSQLEEETSNLYDLEMEFYQENDEEVDESGKGFNSLREAMRRKSKLTGRRSPQLDLGKNGGGVRENMFGTSTQLVLRKLVNKETVTAVKTRVHTARGANIYHAVGIDSATEKERALALKVFKTSKNDFSHSNGRDESGRKYDQHFANKSIRRRLKISTEREYKCMSRAAAALAPDTVTATDEKLASSGHGARVPKPLVLREHILITAFVGTDGHPAASLEDSRLSTAQLRTAYTDLLRAVRRLYQRARLVHGQLLASNILYHDAQCWITDLGHAVEANSENDMVLLISDLDNLDVFFRSHGVPAVTKRSVGLLDVKTAKEYVVVESPDKLLRRFAALEPLLRD